MNGPRDIYLTLTNLDWPVMAAIGVNGFNGIHTHYTALKALTLRYRMIEHSLYSNVARMA